MLLGFFGEGVSVPLWPWPGKVLFAVRVVSLVVVNAVLIVHIYRASFPLQRVRAIIAVHKFLRHCYNETIIIDRALVREVDHV